MVAKFNNTATFTKDFKFNTEQEVAALEQGGFDAMTEKKLDGGNEYGISTRQYTINLVILILLFSANSFIFWLGDFQQEYIGTDMYILFYANGVVAIISGYINLMLYPKIGMKWLLISTDSVGIIATLFIILTQ